MILFKEKLLHIKSFILTLQIEKRSCETPYEE